MEFATVGLSTLLPKLAQLLHEKYMLHKGTREGIQFLHKELEAMHAALEKVGEVPIEQLDKPRRIWAQNVRELSYDMEDIIDTYMVDVEGPQPPSERGTKNIFKKMKRKFTKALAQDEVAKEIDDIKMRAKELAEQYARYKVDDIVPPKKTTIDSRLIEALYTDATKIVGIEEAKEEVIKMLTEGDGGQQKRIVSIAGFGGLGKTTLAKAVYDEIKGRFDCTAIVSVSRNPDTQKLLKDILYQLDKKAFTDIHSKMLDERLLIEEATEFLKNKRYLIIIDDIWDKAPWDTLIRHALIENNMRSRIITTTRNVSVAKHVGDCYNLKPLSDEKSEMLFYGRIFGSKENCSKEIYEVSKKILKKCGGVPLAIITTSSLLANKSKNIKVWNDVCGSIGSGIGRNPCTDDIRNILLPSYYDLPSHLKTCLVYLSIFPEDYEITKDRLIWRWVAEGFIQQDQKVGFQSFLETGESYFNELLNRSLIQPAVMDEYGTPHACRVHDTVLDLIISLSKEECFLTTLSGDEVIESRVRWLSLHNNTTSWPTMNVPKLRSLTIFSAAGVEIIEPMPSLSHYLLLRVLDLQGCTVKDLASLGFLGTLSHLRYLGAPRNTRRYPDPRDQHPVQIGKLRFLQTLDLSQADVELPSNVITGLQQLVCLHGGSEYCRDTYLTDGMKNLTSLEVLKCVSLGSESIAEELGHLTKLRVLHFRLYVFRRSLTEALVESLDKLEKLESLCLGYSPSSSELDLDGSMAEPLGNLCRLCIGAVMYLPTWIEPASLPILTYLEIGVRYERSNDFQVLGTLRCLRHLKFSVSVNNAIYMRGAKRYVVGPDAFPCVVRCDIDIDERGVFPSIFPQGAMPRLQDFTFNIGRQQLWSFGDGSFTLKSLGLCHLPSLRSVTVTGLHGVGFGYDHDSLEAQRKIREKLEHEATVMHPNRPLRIHWSRYR